MAWGPPVERLDLVADLYRRLGKAIYFDDTLLAYTATRQIVEACRIFGAFDHLSVTYESADTIISGIEMSLDEPFALLPHETPVSLDWRP